MNNFEKFRQHLEASQRVLITSHISPDPDAISSVLLLGRTLQSNFPNKTVEMVLEETPSRDVSFLGGYNRIRFAPLLASLEDYKPDLLIIVDANTYDRISRAQVSEVQSYVNAQKIKVAVIDHHELEGADRVDLLINNKRPATAEEIYSLCFDNLGLKKPSDYAQTTLLGIISDTQRHKFDHPGYRETFRIISELLDAGASIESLENKLERYSKDQLLALSHLAANIVDSGQGFTYSFVSDDFAEQWLDAKRSLSELKNGIEIFVGQFIRNFEDNSWGFVVYPELVSNDNIYGVSLRSMSGVKDVSKIAHKLGGGGHKPAAGAKVKADSVNDAIQKVQQAISSH